MAPRFRIKIATFILAGAIGLIFGGCASAPNVDLDAARRSQIKKIAILGIAEPAEPQLANLGGAASAFGLIGGLVQGANNADNAKQFTAGLKKQNVTFAPPLTAAISEALKAGGLQVVDAHDQRPKPAADGKSDDYSGVHVDADAMLMVWYGAFGYISEPSSMKYQPWILIRARLLDANTKQELYFKTFVVGWKMKIDKVVYMPADAKFRYKSYDDVMSHIADAAQGLLASQAMVASRIGADLARSP